MKRSLASLLLLISSSFVFAACATTESGGGPVRMSVEGLDATCAADEDCVPVYVGEMCEDPLCHCVGGAAINATSLPVYNAELAARRSQCDGSSHGVACSCAIHEVACENRLCVVH
jgi:hypothetical protein